MKKQERRKKIRVVLDTNVLVSAWFWEGNESKVVELIESSFAVGYTSPPLLQELKKVMGYPKFGLSMEDVASALGYYQIVLKVVEPKVKVEIVHDDPSDNKVLECALTVKADVIVSGDKHLLALGEFKNIKILSPIEFLKLMNVLKHKIS